MNKALIIGSNGAIGQSLVASMSRKYDVYTLSRENTDYSDSSLLTQKTKLRSVGRFSTIICCIGSLHSELVYPEKRLSDLDEAVLMEYFRVNTVLPALCLKHFVPLLESQLNSRFVVLSAMVGSVTDNSLGGWYGYRSSKAALNMMVKTASIETSRTNKRAAIVALHPGTTVGKLSQPFATGIEASKYYTPEQTALRIIDVAESITANDSGRFLNWDGREIPW